MSKNEDIEDIEDVEDILEPLDEHKKTEQMGSLLPRLISMENDLQLLELRVKGIQEVYERRMAELIDERDEYDRRRRDATAKLEHWRTIAQALRDQVKKLTQGDGDE